MLNRQRLRFPKQQMLMIVVHTPCQEIIYMISISVELAEVQSKDKMSRNMQSQLSLKSQTMLQHVASTCQQTGDVTAFEQQEVDLKQSTPVNKPHCFIIF